MAWKRLLAVVAVACVVSSTRAGDPKTDLGGATALSNPPFTAALSDGLRALLLDALPDPLVEDDSHWGGQRMVAHGVVWHGHGLHIHPDVTKTPRNDGRWWKVKATADRLPDSLVVDLRDLRQPAPGKTTFTLFVSFDARVEYEHQTWDDGLRLNSGRIEARMRVNLMLACEATAKLETAGKLLPDAVFGLRVTEAHLGYDHFEVDHILGVGGELAKVIGAAAREAVEQWRPSLERKLLEKADAAIVKAGDVKEVRLSVEKLLKGE